MNDIAGYRRISKVWANRYSMPLLVYVGMVEVSYLRTVIA